MYTHVNNNKRKYSTHLPVGAFGNQPKPIHNDVNCILVFIDKLVFLTKIACENEDRGIDSYGFGDWRPSCDCRT